MEQGRRGHRGHFRGVQGEGEIYMAYTSAAVYDAVVAIRGRLRAIRAGNQVRPQVPPSTAAVVEAAYRTLSAYFPSSCNPANASVHGARASCRLQRGNGRDPGRPAKESGSIVGLAAASGIIALRTGDGRMTPIGTSSSFEKAKRPGAGVWRLSGTVRAGAWMREWHVHARRRRGRGRCSRSC